MSIIICIALEGRYLIPLSFGVVSLTMSGFRWGDNSYGVEYVTSKTSPMGPFSNTSTKILSADPEGVIAQGPGSHSVLHIPHTDDYYMVYHRRPIDDMASNDRYVCIDHMYFDSEDDILPVRITKEGVRARPLS